MNKEVIKEKLALTRLWIAIFYSAFLAGVYTWSQNKNTGVGVIAGLAGLVALLFFKAHNKHMKELKKGCGIIPSLLNSIILNNTAFNL